MSSITPRVLKVHPRNCYVKFRVFRFYRSTNQLWLVSSTFHLGSGEIPALYKDAIAGLLYRSVLHVLIGNIEALRIKNSMVKAVYCVQFVETKINKS